MISNHSPGNYWYWAMLDENIIIAARIDTRNLTQQTGTDAYKAIHQQHSLLLIVFCFVSVCCLSNKLKETVGFYSNFLIIVMNW